MSEKLGIGIVKNKFDGKTAKKLLECKLLQNFIAILGAVVISVILCKSIIKADTVWELADEAGYLSNVAYFLGYDWDDVRATMPYYAYGYSVFLIPVFFLTTTGVQLIRGAMCVNLFFAIGTYIILIYLLEKVGKQNNRMITSMISFVVCLNSYLCCNVLKVDSESISVFWYCLTAVTLYKTLEHETKQWFIILGVVSSYLFFIHTRMFILIITLIITMFITLWIYGERKNYIQLVFFGVAFLICFGILYSIKYSIVNYATGLDSPDDVTRGNLVDGNYILDRLKWAFAPENLYKYVFLFFSKIYYIIIVSGGTIFFGYVHLCHDLFFVRRYSSKEEMQSYAVKLFFSLGMILMVIVCIFNGGGNFDDFRPFFYSRYYENTVIPMVAFSILTLITTRETKKTYFRIVLLQLSIGIIVSKLSNYLFSSDIRMDTARIPGFSWLVKNTNTFLDMILFGTIIVTLLMNIYYLSNKLIKMKAIVVILAVFIVTWKSTSLGIEIIDNVHVNGRPDVQIVEHILSEKECNSVYMIDDESYKISRIYSRMQVLLKDIPLKVIYKEELGKMDQIPSETWIITYTTTTIRDTYMSEFNYVMTGDVFELWKK